MSVNNVSVILREILISTFTYNISSLEHLSRLKPLTRYKYLCQKCHSGLLKFQGIDWSPAHLLLWFQQLVLEPSLPASPLRTSEPEFLDFHAFEFSAMIQKQECEQAVYSESCSCHKAIIFHLGSHVLDLVEGSLQHRVHIRQHVLLCCSHFLISYLLKLYVNLSKTREIWLR